MSSSRKKNTILRSNELGVLELFSQEPQPLTQRELSRRTGLSLGLINAVIRKLVTTGYLKTSRLNRRSLEYILTPQGFAEKARKSYHYMLRTLHDYQALKLRFDVLIDNLQREGIRKFYLAGDGEMVELLASFFEDEGVWYSRAVPARITNNAVILNATPKRLAHNGARIVDVVPFLGGDAA